MTKEFYDWLIKIFFKSVIAEEVVDGIDCPKNNFGALEIRLTRKILSI
jgi:hypothetical protein